MAPPEPDQPEPGTPTYDGARHAAGTHGVRWGPTNVVSSGCRDGTVALWDPTTRTTKLLLGGHGSEADPCDRWVRCTAWSPDGSLLATGGPRRVCVWTAAGELRCSLNLASATALVEAEPELTPEPAVDAEPAADAPAEPAADAAPAPAEPAADTAPAPTDPAIDAPAEPAGTEDPEPYYVLSLCWVDANTLAIGGGSNTVAVWKLDLMALAAQIYGETPPRYALAHSDHADSIRCLAACGPRLASGSDDCTVRVWDVGPNESDILVRGFGAGVTSICWSPGGALLVAGSADSSVRVARAEPGRQFGAVAWVWRGSSEKVTGGVVSVDYSPDGSRLAVAAEGRVFVFGGVLDATLGDLLAILEAPGLRYDIAFSPDGRALCYGRSLKREPVAAGAASSDEWPVAFLDAPLIDDEPY